MCFNGPKTWQLGWYNAYHVDLPIDGNFSWRGSLIGFAEKSSAISSDHMIVRIRNKVVDYYIHLNRKIGMNDGTQEAPNQVLVTTRVPGIGYASSDLVAKVNSMEMYHIPFFNGSVNPLIIRVETITFNSIPARAYISIEFNATQPSSIQNTLTTPNSVTQKRIPTRFPTKVALITRSMVPTIVTPKKSKPAINSF
jgi:hypothetical protein